MEHAEIDITKLDKGTVIKILTKSLNRYELTVEDPAKCMCLVDRKESKPHARHVGVRGVREIKNPLKVNERMIHGMSQTSPLLKIET